MSAIFDGPDMFDPAIFDAKTQFTVSLVENVPVTDSVTASAQFKRDIVDAGGSIFDGPDMFDPAIFDTTLKTIEITDSVDTELQKSVSLTEDAIPITDDVVRKFDAFRVIIEATIPITDSVVRKFDAFRTFAENTPIAEALASRIDTFRTFTENTPIADSVAALRAISRDIVEAAIPITDSVVRNAGKFRTLTGLVTISEVLTTLKDRIASRTDTATLCLQDEDEANLCL